MSRQCSDEVFKQHSPKPIESDQSPNCKRSSVQVILLLKIPFHSFYFFKCISRILKFWISENQIKIFFFFAKNFDEANLQYYYYTKLRDWLGQEWNWAHRVKKIYSKSDTCKFFSVEMNLICQCWWFDQIKTLAWCYNKYYVWKTMSLYFWISVIRLFVVRLIVDVIVVMQLI